MQHDTLNITFIEESALQTHPDIETYDYIIISGGDGSIRRVIQTLQDIPHSATFILNPIGSFNVVAKLHKVPKIEKCTGCLGKWGNTSNPKTPLLYTQ